VREWYALQINGLTELRYYVKIIKNIYNKTCDDVTFCDAKFRL